MMTHPAGVLGYGTGLPSGGSDTPKGWARVFLQWFRTPNDIIYPQCAERVDPLSRAEKLAIFDGLGRSAPS